MASRIFVASPDLISAGGMRLNFMLVLLNQWISPGRAEGLSL